MRRICLCSCLLFQKFLSSAGFLLQSLRLCGRLSWRKVTALSICRILASYGYIQVFRNYTSMYPHQLLNIPRFLNINFLDQFRTPEMFLVAILSSKILKFYFRLCECVHFQFLYVLVLFWRVTLFLKFLRLPHIFFVHLIILYCAESVNICIILLNVNDQSSSSSKEKELRHDEHLIPSHEGLHVETYFRSLPAYPCWVTSKKRGLLQRQLCTQRSNTQTIFYLYMEEV